MALTRNILFLSVAAACFIVAFLVDVGAAGGNAAAWSDAGLAAFVVAHLP